MKHLNKNLAWLILAFIFLFNISPVYANRAAYDLCAKGCRNDYNTMSAAGNEDSYNIFQNCLTTTCKPLLTSEEQQALDLELAEAFLGQQIEIGSNASVGGGGADTPCGKTFCLNVPIGDLRGFNIDKDAGVNGNTILGDYIKQWYGFLLGTIGIMATVMIMWGGFKYLTSRGDKGVIDTAKAQIISAITGVALAFGTYSILMLINPQLLTITTPNLPGLQGGENVLLETGSAGSGANASVTGNGTCSVATGSSVIGGIDFGPVNGKGAYATNPCHIANVNGYYQQIGQIDSAQDAQEFISRKFPNSPITGEMVWTAHMNTGVDAAVIMAEMAQDSSMGTAGLAVRTFNPGNVGNDDAGNTRNFGDWASGVNGLATYLATRKPQ